MNPATGYYPEMQENGHMKRIFRSIIYNSQKLKNPKLCHHGEIAKSPKHCVKVTGRGLAPPDCTISSLKSLQTSGGEPTAPVPQRAVCITECSKTFATTALDSALWQSPWPEHLAGTQLRPPLLLSSRKDRWAKLLFP